MDALLFVPSLFTLLRVVTASVPPDACAQDFRWEDCGQQPKAVMYYWKPGSRCEVGIWRGCRPSLNMFKDEYECVSTCIFTVRAHASDFHNLQMLEEEPVTQSEESDYEDGTNEESVEESTGDDDTTDGTPANDIGNNTSPANVTDSVSGNSSVSDGDGNMTTLDNDSIPTTTTEAAK